MIKLSCETKNNSEDLILSIMQTMQRALEDHVRSGKTLEDIRISIKDDKQGKTHIVLS